MHRGGALSALPNSTPSVDQQVSAWCFVTPAQRPMLARSIQVEKALPSPAQHPMKANRPYSESLSRLAKTYGDQQVCTVRRHCQDLHIYLVWTNKSVRGGDDLSSPAHQQVSARWWGTAKSCPNALCGPTGQCSVKIHAPPGPFQCGFKHSVEKLFPACLIQCRSHRLIKQSPEMTNRSLCSVRERARLPVRGRQPASVSWSSHRPRPRLCSHWTPGDSSLGARIIKGR
jgi:hypothetical protein